MTLTVPCESAVTTSMTAALRHRCPYADEADAGAVHITWTSAGATFELHALVAWLDQFANTAVSHEDITYLIRGELAAADGITGVAVRSEWETAGARVEVIAGVVPREPGRRGGG